MEPMYTENDQPQKNEFLTDLLQVNPDGLNFTH
jgi:hypothetical protein